MSQRDNLTNVRDLDGTQERDSENPLTMSQRGNVKQSFPGLAGASKGIFDSLRMSQRDNLEQSSRNLDGTQERDSENPLTMSQRGNVKQSFPGLAGASKGIFDSLRMSQRDNLEQSSRNLDGTQERDSENPLTMSQRGIEPRSGGPQPPILSIRLLGRVYVESR
jgi:hypothetical protein